MPSPTEQILARLKMELSYAANRIRQEKAQRLIDYYNGEQLEHLDDVLTKQFKDPTSLKMQLAVDNLTQFVADETSRVFDSPAKLSSDDKSGQKLLDTILADGLFSSVLKTAEVYTSLTGITALHPWWDDVNQKLRTRIIPSSVLFVAQNREDPTAPDAVIYIREWRNTITAIPRIEYIHWDVDYCFIFDYMGVYYPPGPSNPDGINPYGIIPFAFFRDQVPIGEFFQDIDEVLLTAQENLNVLLTSANQLAKYQCFSQPVIKGWDKEKGPISVDPTMPIYFPPSLRDEQPGSFEFVTPASKIGDILHQASDLATRICVRRGISMAALKDGSSTMSGYALKLANSKLDRRRVDSIPLARFCLLQWWEICKVIWNTHNPNDKVNLQAQLKIDFVEPTYSEDPAKALDMDLKKIIAGLTSPIEILMRENPELDGEAAKAKFEQNLEYQKTLKARFGLADLLAAAKGGGSQGGK